MCQCLGFAGLSRPSVCGSASFDPSLLTTNNPRCSEFVPANPKRNRSGGPTGARFYRGGPKPGLDIDETQQEQRQMASIKKRGKSWVATVKLGGRGGKRAKKSFKRQTDARLWATALERDFALKGVVAASLSGTVGDLIERYEKQIWPIKRWGDSKAWNLAQITKDIGAVQLKNLKKQVVVEYGLKLSKHLGR